MKSDSDYQRIPTNESQIVPHNRLTHGDLEVEAMKRTVMSGHWAAGPRVHDLEAVLAARAETKHAVCVSSGLAALRLTLMGLGVGRGDQVAVPAYSCVALPNAVLSCGALALPLDVEEGTWNLSLSATRKVVKEVGVKAVISVNLFGLPAPMPLKETKKNNRELWIEDCAHSFGRWVGKEAFGSRADAAILSFYATKLIGAGEGGAVLTDCDNLAAFVRDWRDYTDRKPDCARGNYKMTDLEATLALCQIERLDGMLERRACLAQRYFELLEPMEQEGLFRLPQRNSERIWYRFAVEIPNCSLDVVITECQLLGVEVQPPVADWREIGTSAHPIANRAYRSLISLPLYPTLTYREQEQVVQTFIKVCRQNSCLETKIKNC